MRQSIFSAIPRILMEAIGIDFVTRKGRNSSYFGGSREGRGDLHWEGTLRAPETLGWGEAGGLETLEALGCASGSLCSSWTPSGGFGTFPQGSIPSNPPRQDR